MSNYRRADRKAQWYADNWPGDRIDPNVVVLHTTEGGSWPSYAGGASAPHYTAMPDKVNKRLVWRAHFPDEMSSRALRNEAGGVETNTLNCVQVELVGSCDRKDGYGAIYWPDAPDWALREVGRFVADQYVRHGTKLEAPAVWLPYPQSYGSSEARMSGREWSRFYGVCGHQHVPENSHGDPGDIDIAAILAYAAKYADVKAPAERERKPKRPWIRGRVTHARADVREARGHAKSKRRRGWLDAVLRLIRRGPRA